MKTRWSALVISAVLVIAACSEPASPPPVSKPDVAPATAAAKSGFHQQGLVGRRVAPGRNRLASGLSRGRHARHVLAEFDPRFRHLELRRKTPDHRRGRTEIRRRHPRADRGHIPHPDTQPRRAGRDSLRAGGPGATRIVGNSSAAGSARERPRSSPKRGRPPCGALPGVSRISRAPAYSIVCKPLWNSRQRAGPAATAPATASTGSRPSTATRYSSAALRRRARPASKP